MGPTRAIAPRQPASRLRSFLILRDGEDRIGSFVRLPKANIFKAPERTIIIVNGNASACSSGIINCAGIAIVDVQRPIFGIIHTGFPDDIAGTMQFALKTMRCRPGDLVIGITGLKGYPPEALQNSLAVAGSFGPVVYAKLGVSADIAVDYQERKIFSANKRFPGWIETPAARF